MLSRFNRCIRSSALKFRSKLPFHFSSRFVSYTQTELYNSASDNCVKFWRDAAKDVEWDTFPETIFNPHDTKSQLNYSWFSDGKMNLTETAIDRHIKNGRGEQNAIIHDSPVTNTVRHITYNSFLEQVELMAGALQERGVNVGDRVIIYMPMIPEALISIYACVRIGAIHTVVFGGFAAPELAKRILDCDPKIILSASGSKEGLNKTVEYKPLLDKAIEICQNSDAKNCDNVKNIKCIVYQREKICQAQLQDGRDEDWNNVMNKSNIRAKPVIVSATHPLYILYTSGTTGTPKGIIRECGGHAVALRWTMEYFYGLDPGDTTCFASDIGWVVGHCM